MKNRKFRSLYWVKIILTILMLFMILHQPISAQGGEPSVNIALTEQVMKADVGPDDNGIVVFPGIVSITMNRATKVIVNLSAIDTWNSAIVTPKSIIFTENADKPITVKITVPLGTSFDGIGTVKVTGRWTSYPGENNGSVYPETGAVGRIDINPFYKFSLKSKELSKEVIAGSKTKFELIINNEGNYIETFSINPINIKGLSPNKIEVIASQYNVEIQEKENKSIEFTINTHKDTKAGMYLIQIQISSDNGLDEGVPPQNFTFNLNIGKNPSQEQSETGLTKVLSEPFNILIIVLLAIVIVFLLIIYWVKRKNKN